MAYRAARKYRPGVLDYNVAWLLFYFGGLFGLHRFYQGKWVTGILYLFSMGLFGIGWIVDLFCLNEQIHEGNWKKETAMSLGRY
jgi:TM2 domain-containing membrane protein YozV